MEVLCNLLHSHSPPPCVNSDGNEAILGYEGKDNRLVRVEQQDGEFWILDTMELPDCFQRDCYVRKKFLFWIWVIVAEITCLGSIC